MLENLSWAMIDQNLVLMCMKHFNTFLVIEGACCEIVGGAVVRIFARIRNGFARVVVAGSSELAIWSKKCEVEKLAHFTRKAQEAYGCGLGIA